MFELTPLESEALGLSLRVGFWAVLGSLPLGLFVAWLLVRVEFPGRTIVNGLVHLPLVLPPVVVGYLLLVLLGRNGPVGSLFYDWFGWTFAFTWQGATIASAVVAFPLMVRSIRLGLELVDRRLETAARTLGATRLDAFWTVTVPLVLPGILTGAVLAFARSIGEFGATITFVSNIPGQTQTLPLALYTVTQSPGGDQAALRLVLISCILAFAALAASELLARHVKRRLLGGSA
ncbi:MAG: molybdate ABC transporter permease subunit [Alphaproteobacteria bacterium]|jgi:molybdate transport system permease protein|nr:molybdate ABC transporter permease subunit [Rhodospirillaceae bacterium]MBT6203966.1 molybdate ABC transporter permease subunit [Rhodospirillaceae bacterium]MBT6512440.1 molybdate ABC transporter permease subunit [Rhodospirillaceae bacterium]MBT7647814.1 molybdate ABC transporter permease subunit [Rhodospirillaceae bacterium]MDG2481727.1 molybdate ABC transporter permease subunit [Alphaproteobacteria bacterium]